MARVLASLERGPPEERPPPDPERPGRLGGPEPGWVLVAPHKVWITPEGRVLLANLLAPRAGMAAYRLMSPEQVTGKALRPASEVYSLAAVAWELVTGLPLIEEESDFWVLERARRGAARYPRAHRKDLPGPAAELLVRALDTDPERRPTAAAFAEGWRASGVAMDEALPGMWVRELFESEIAQARSSLSS